MPLTEINGIQLNYMRIECTTSEVAEELVLIHGLAASMGFWCPHYVEEFSASFHVTLYDLRGHGRSSVPDEGYTPDNMANDLAELLEFLGIEKAHFLAHSYGGAVALWHACRRPESVASLVLADTHLSEGRKNAHRFPWKQGRDIATLLNRFNIPIDSEDPFFGYHLLTVIARMKADQASFAPEIQQALGSLICRFDRRTALKWLQLVATESAEKEIMAPDGLSADRLSRLDLPLLAMYGEQSQALPTMHFLKDIWPQAEFHIFRNAGHFFPLSRQDEVVETCQLFWGKSQSLPLAPLRQHIGY
ncbi:alpha/beta fold hydrolase [Desulfolithobacter sp.]